MLDLETVCAFRTSWPSQSIAGQMLVLVHFSISAKPSDKVEGVEGYVRTDAAMLPFSYERVLKVIGASRKESEIAGIVPDWNGSGTWIFSDRSKSGYSRSGGVTFAIQES
jgi:hypothetical protein